MPVASICANIASHTVGTPALCVTPSSCIRSHNICASLVAENTSFAPTVAAAKGMPQLLAWNIGTIGSTTLRFDMSNRSEEHTSELQSLMRNSYAVL